MDATDRRHFPLTLAAYNTVCVIASAFIRGTSHDDIVYNTPRLAHALDALSRELHETDSHETDGARRHSALLFALDAAPRVVNSPDELGFTQPMR